MILRPPRSTRTDTLCPDPTLVRSRYAARAPIRPAKVRRRTGDPTATAQSTIVRLPPHSDRHPPVPAAVQVSKWIAGCCPRSEEHTSELQSLMRISYAVFCLKKTKKTKKNNDSEHRRQHISTQ